MTATDTRRSATLLRWGALLVRRKWVVVIAFLVVALTLEALFAVTAVSNTACTLCHTSRQAEHRQEGTSHSALSCLSCHKQEGVLGIAALNVRAAANLGAALLPGVGTPPELPRYVEQRCVSCHEATLLSTVTSEGLKMSHVTPQREGLPCAECHVAAGHPAEDDAEVDLHSRCASCHETDIASRDCGLCHETPTPVVPAAADFAHPAGWAAGHGAGDLITCSLCHQPSFCRECHGVDLPHRTSSFIYDHGNEARDPSACTDLCHSQKTCDTCHLIPMPHAADYLPAHSKEALLHGRDVCTSCHLETGCVTCHLRHIHPGVPDSVKEKLSQAERGD
jgi:hypothetical protein